MAINDCLRYFELCDKMPLGFDEFYESFAALFPQYAELDKECFLEVLISNKAPFYRIYNNNKIMIDSINRDKLLENCELCFVDIETTGTKDVLSGQIIEIGAIKVRNNEIIDTFEKFAFAPSVPEEITELTGINASMLRNAPRLKNVLSEFKEFLGHSVFVAHNVSFDYGFISESMRHFNLGVLLNARLCTIELSRKSILSQKYALSYLNKMLGINNDTSHRALADALTSFEVYKICLFSLPKYVKTMQDLIDFSKGKITYHTRCVSKNALYKYHTKYKINDTLLMR